MAEGNGKLYYDYTAAETYCRQIGLEWLGNEFLYGPDAEAKALNFTQEQVDMAMRHHLWQVKHLFEPKNYSFKVRVAIAFYFLTGWTPSK